MTKRQLEKKYDCQIFKDTCTDDGFKVWCAYLNDCNNGKFGSAIGFTLDELEEDIENNLYDDEM